MLLTGSQTRWTMDGAGTTAYTYNAAGQLLTEDGPFASDTVTNTYASRLRVALSLQQPTGAWANGFGYDTTRRLATVTSPAGVFTNQYITGVAGGSGYSSHLLQNVFLPNGSHITNYFDVVARLLETDLRKSDTTVLDSYHYIYNVANQRTNLTRADTSTVGYRYDNIGQLTVADSSVNTEVRGYYYDAAWNLDRRTNNGVVGTFVVDNKNELTNGPSPVNKLTCDNNGNTITSHGGKWVYSYDAENRLVQWFSYASSPSAPANGDLFTQFIYDSIGRLRERIEYVWNNTSQFSQLGGVPPPAGGGTTYWQWSSETHYIYDGNRVIQERDTNNTPTLSYTRGNDLSGTLEGAGGIGGLLARSDGYSGGNWMDHNYYFADGNGNVTYMLNGSQSMVASYRYDPFGNLISSSGSLAAANVYRFSSKEIHVNSGMYYYLYRFYDPNLQRWINQDPLADSGFQNPVRAPRAKYKVNRNLYLFVSNDPVGDWDYFGLDNPGCDGLPKPLTKCITRKKMNCYLQCCAEHDKCYYDNGCTSKSWRGKEGADCSKCNSAVTRCFAKAGLSDCDKPPKWFCPRGERKGEFFDDYSKIPADCWEDGKKPPRPQ